MGAVKPWHWIVILVLLVLLFGADKLPNFASNLGRSLKVFKKEVKELRDDDSKDSQAQIQQPQEGTYYTEPTQSGQTAQSAEGSSQK